MRKIVAAIIFILPVFSFAQDAKADSNYIFWSKNRRLQQGDFQIKVGNVSSSYSFAQYSFDYQVNGAFGLAKDYKKKIRNYFIKPASWLDTTYDVGTSLKYQQTLFDMAEVYVRQFRKLVYDNRKKITWGKLKLDELNSRMVTEFAKRRVEYDTATNSGTIAGKQKEWEALVEKELNDLKDFSAN